MKKRAFTLIELLVVVAIIGILATIVVISYSNVQAKSRNSKRKSDLQTIASATEMFFADNKFYPLGLNTVDTNGVQRGKSYALSTKRIARNMAAPNNWTCDADAAGTTEEVLTRSWACLVGSYLDSWPEDPNNANGYLIMGARLTPSPTPNLNYFGYKIVTSSFWNGEDTYEVSGTNATACINNAAEFADIATGKACTGFQVSKGKNAQNWIITNPLR